MAAAARAADADAVVVASTRTTVPTANRELLIELAGDHPVYLAGRGADAEVARVLGARLLPADLVAALEHVVPRRSALFSEQR